ncbi:DUF5677 domain-containing protein [Streptomyces sp. NPDC014623]|uniref:DUF5677 domain-containing protein n=1 Tax=Streptomyces sp. NPDC014623 TaxID=3364875 RepID=UPI0036F88ACA
MEIEDSTLLQFVLKELNGGIASGEYKKDDNDLVDLALRKAVEKAVENSRELVPQDHAWLERTSEKWALRKKGMMEKVRRANLRRWGRGFRLYRKCLLTAEVMNQMMENCIGEWVTESDQTINEPLLGIPSTMGGRPLKVITLLSLHSRACAIGNEILLLAENGFPEAVKARTRSLHELAVTADCLSALGPLDTDVSDRYGAWAVAEARKEARALSAPGSIPEELTGREAEIARRAEAAWGSDFFRQNGWAAPLFPGRRPPIPFTELEKFTDMSHMRSYYLAGNEAIHGGPSALTSRARFRNGAIFATSSEVQHEATREFLAVAAITLSVVCTATCEVIASVTGDFDSIFAVKAMRDAVEDARIEFKNGGMHR